MMQPKVKHFIGAMMLALMPIAPASWASNSITTKPVQLAQDTLSGYAQLFSKVDAKPTRKVSAEQLVEAFDSVAEKSGQIYLQQPSGQTDLEIQIGLKDEVTVTEQVANRTRKTLPVYTGTVNGHSAMLIRSGEYLSISWMEKNSGKRFLRRFVNGGAEQVLKTKPQTRFRADNNDVIVKKQDIPSLAPLNALPSLNAPAPLNAPAELQVAPTNGNLPIKFWVFVHNDTQETNSDTIHAGYFGWWLTHLKNDILPNTEISIEYVFNADGITNMVYPISSDPGPAYSASSVPLYRYAGTIAAVGTSIFSYLDRLGISYTQGRDKFLLFTEENLDSSTAGQAVQPWGVGIASDNDYSTVAQQFGELMGGWPKDGAVIYTGGWWCETLMYKPDLASSLRTSCNKYSDANRDNIRAYYHWTPNQ